MEPLLLGFEGINDIFILFKKSEITHRMATPWYQSKAKLSFSHTCIM